MHADFGYRPTFLGQCVAILVSWVVALFVVMCVSRPLLLLSDAASDAAALQVPVLQIHQPSPAIKNAAEGLRRAELVLALDVQPATCSGSEQLGALACRTELACNDDTGMRAPAQACTAAG